MITTISPGGGYGGQDTLVIWFFDGGNNIMDLAEELAEAEKKQKEVVDQANTMGEQKQLLLQEAFKLEGEIRAIKRLMAKEK